MHVLCTCTARCGIATILKFSDEVRLIKEGTNGLAGTRSRLIRMDFPTLKRFIQKLWCHLLTRDIL